MRRFLILTAAVLVLGVRPAAAQEPSFREDLRFVEALRARGDNDLAMEFLKKLQADAPPELAKELPLEFAKTGLRVAAEQPETGKRLALYKEARDNFQKFIDANPGHPRVAEANVDIARVLNLVGKTELSQALLASGDKTQRELAAQARATLELAARRLKSAVVTLQATLDGMPAPDGVADPQKKKEAARARALVENDLGQTQLDAALNLYDQSTTYLGGYGNEQAADLLAKAKAALGPLSSGAPANPITWKARAWLGRVQMQTDSAQRARASFQEVIDANIPAAAEGKRLAAYFRMLSMREKPTEEDKKRSGKTFGTGVSPYVLWRATLWRSEYPRFLKTPEGFGVTFLLAKTYLEEAAKKKGAQADDYRSRARALLREVEGSENEFTDQARLLKIRTIAALGGFKKKIAQLQTFEDCYVRSQYEAFQLGEEVKKAATAKEAEEKRKARVEAIVEVLRRGLKLAAGGKAPAAELNNARTMLTYWLLNTRKLPEAIAVGEGFARDDPRSSQAEMCAVYALQAYQQLIDRKKARDEDASDDKARLLSLARYMEDRWPAGMPGQMARHSQALQMIKDGNPAEAVKKLEMITPGYGSYTIVCYQLADTAMKAHKEKAEPIAGDRPGDYRKRALAALQRMPGSALGPDPVTNTLFVAGKAMLGRELFTFHRYQEMLDLANGLLPRLAKLKFNDDDEKDKGTRKQMQFELVDVTLFARYGLADAAFRAGDNAQAAKLLDPLVDAAAKEGAQERANLQNNAQLATALLRTALLANLQLGNVARCDRVLDVLDQVAATGNSNDILRLLAVLIRTQVEEVRKKGDKDALEKAVKGYTTLLDKRIAKQKSLTPDFIRVLAGCYSSMGQHEKAAGELAKVPPPKGKPGKTPTEEEKSYRAVQLAMIRELRLSNTAATLKKARAVLDGILGTPKAPGWGRRDFYALKEQGVLLEAEKNYKEAFTHWAGLMKRLAPVARERGGQTKENYLECFYHMVSSFLEREKAGGKAGAAARTAAKQIADFEKNWEDFGSPASKKRFEDLLASDPALKTEYETRKNQKR
jgi:hypothetical protein